MSNTTVRISWEARNLLREISQAEGRSMQAVVERALETYRRQRYLEEMNEDWSRVREDIANWYTVEADRNRLDDTLADGLPSDEVWTEDGDVVAPRKAKTKKTRKKR